MKILALTALLITATPVTAYAGGSVTCTADNTGTVSCSVTYTW